MCGKMGPFSSWNNDFAGYLRRVGSNGSPQEHAFVARNFLLDEGIVEERLESYSGNHCVCDHGDYSSWRILHERYLREKVTVVRGDDGPAPVLDLDDPESFPETFRYIPTSSQFLSSDISVELIRVAELDFVARTAGFAIDTVKRLAADVIASEWDASTPAYAQLNDVLHQWGVRIDARPVFSGFWAEVSDLFGERPSDDQPDAADQLRDRFGLAHLNPGLLAGVPVSVMIFRYPVKGIAGMKGVKGSKPLVPPTVLDSKFSAAFCPSPAGSLTGHTVDLGTNGDHPCREVLHPAIMFKAEHVWRVGEIRSSVTDNMIRDARTWHLECIREDNGLPDYALDTDG